VRIPPSNNFLRRQCSKNNRVTMRLIMATDFCSLKVTKLHVPQPTDKRRWQILFPVSQPTHFGIHLQELHTDVLKSTTELYATEHLKLVFVPTRHMHVTNQNVKSRAVRPLHQRQFSTPEIVYNKIQMSKRSVPSWNQDTSREKVNNVHVFL
jgi:hypothetical protein